MANFMDKNHDPYAAAAARALLSEREDKKPGLDELLDHMRVAHGLAVKLQEVVSVG